MNLSKFSFLNNIKKSCQSWTCRLNILPAAPKTTGLFLQIFENLVNRRCESKLVKMALSVSSGRIVRRFILPDLSVLVKFVKSIFYVAS